MILRAAWRVGGAGLGSSSINKDDPGLNPHIGIFEKRMAPSVFGRAQRPENSLKSRAPLSLRVFADARVRPQNVATKLG